jgi:hypothetical protein
MGNYCIIPDTQNNIVELTNNDCNITIKSTAIVLPDLPNHHNFTHYTGGSDQLTPQDIGAQPSGNYITEGDSRLTNNRYPIAHKSSHAIGGSDPLTPADIGAQPSGNYIVYPVQYTDLSNSTTVGLNVYKRVAKAWVSFDGTTTPITIKSSFNVSSITDNGVGSYTVNFSSPMSNIYYAVLIMARDYNSDTYAMNLAAINSVSSKTVNSVAMVSNYNRTGAYVDSPEYNVLIFGI